MATTERAQEATAGSEVPEVGQLAYDLSAKKVSVLMGEWAGRYMLRPLEGGREWDAVNVRPLTAREELSARLAVKNSGNRGEVIRALGRFAGVLFIVMVAGSCGLVIGVAIAQSGP